MNATVPYAETDGMKWFAIESVGTGGEERQSV